MTKRAVVTLTTARFFGFYALIVNAAYLLSILCFAMYSSKSLAEMGLE
jgi:hypothetical protein